MGRITDRELAEALKEIVKYEEHMVLYNLENCLSSVTNFEARRIIERVIRESEEHLIKTMELLSSIEETKGASQSPKKNPRRKLAEGLGYEEEALKKYDELAAGVEDEKLKKMFAHFRDQEAEHIELINRAISLLGK